MGIFDIFKVKQYKKQIETLSKENQALQEKLNHAETPEMKDAFKLQQIISDLNEQKDSLDNDIKSKQGKIAKLQEDITEKLSSLKNFLYIIHGMIL